ncbi:uncharacterized protein LOC142344131 [Convolutriloba macropyga]|uniref:uncharacterized protein LOC142344131 n=1 Tax=Convolutriloba macropyga TaxID=536237 RepID=UPI003F5213A3
MDANELNLAKSKSTESFFDLEDESYDLRHNSNHHFSSFMFKHSSTSKSNLSARVSNPMKTTIDWLQGTVSSGVRLKRGTVPVNSREQNKVERVQCKNWCFKVEEIVDNFVDCLWNGNFETAQKSPKHGSNAKQERQREADLLSNAIRKQYESQEHYAIDQLIKEIKTLISDFYSEVTQFEYLMQFSDTVISSVEQANWEFQFKLNT